MAYDALKAQKVCELLESQDDGCESLRKCCAKCDLAPSTFLRWCGDNKELAEHYARADRIATDIQFEQFHDLNDEEPPTVEGRVDSGWVQWQRVRLDNKKWEMAKRHPKRLGDRPVPGADPENPLHLKIDREETLDKLIGDRPTPPTA